MKASEFQHVIQAATDVAHDEIVVVGSQAILAQFPNAPKSLLTSLELDVFPKNRPERSDIIDGALGDGSPFHTTFGYWAQGVGWETVIAPTGWQERLIRLDIPTVLRGTVVAWCIEVHDLVLAKLAAGRPHDFTFVEEVIRSQFVEIPRLRDGANRMPIQYRVRTQSRLQGILTRLGRND